MTDDTFVLQAIVRPLECHGRKRRVWHKILLLWLLAAVCAIPQLLFLDYAHERRSTLQTNKCKSIMYRGDWTLKAYSVLLTSFLFIIPTSVMTFCYARITRAVWLRGAVQL